MKISVIIPVYNVENYLEKCINSIINQTYKDLEIILVDDGSTDSSGKICDDYSKKDDRIIVIHKNNNGVSSARNDGLRKATGDYVVFPDSDDYIDSNMYKDMLEQFKDTIDLVCCGYYINDSKKNDKKHEKIINNKLSMEYLMGDDYYKGYVWNKMYKMQIIKKINLFFNENITICEDLLFNTIYINNIRKSVFLDKQYYYYLIRSSSAYNSRIFNEKWLTALDAYSLIFNEYIKCSNNVVPYYYNFLIANLDLMEKIICTNVDC